MTVTTRRRLCFLIPAAILLLFLAGGWAFRNNIAADRQGDWVEVHRGDLVTGFDVAGTLAAVDSDRLGPPPLPDVWDYKISMLAPEGSEVKAGQPVLGFDASELQRTLEEKTAESDTALKEIEKKKADLALRRHDEELKLAEAEARLRKATLKLDAPKDLVGVKERKQVEMDHELATRETKAIRKKIADLERAANAEIRLVETRQQRAASKVAETQSGISQMMVRAPRKGTVVYVTNWRGDKKKVGDTCWRAERAIEIPDLTRMKAGGEVDEVDAGKVQTGQRVSFRLDAHPDEELHGTISFAAKTVQQQRGTTNPVKVLPVEITLDRTDPAKMRPGMRFQGTIELGRARNVTLLPRNAVTVTSQGTIAWRRRLFGVEAIPVKLGRQGDKSVEVLSGIRPGDRVLVPKQDEKQEAKP
jgi:HlyD family secretion protein